MNILGVLCLTAAVLTVSARHKKEWEFLDMKKATREVLMPLYRSETPICHKGPGFYRDPNDCHQYIRCVDDFSSGRRLTLFVGRCRPGLVFDENVSSCNWPELSAPCKNLPEHFKDTASKINSNEPVLEEVSQNNKISEESGYRNKYQSQPYKPIKPDQKLPEHKDKIKNVFQETETQEKIGQSFEDNHESQVQITQQEREPQVAEIPNINEQQQILITEQVREPVVQEKEEVDQQESEPIYQNPDIREPVFEQQIRDSNKAREPVIQDKIHQIQENPKTKQPVIQEQTQQIQENPKTRQPAIQQNEHKESINQQQNHEEAPVWDESDSQEKIYQPIQDQQIEHESKNKHKDPINQQKNHNEVPVWDEADSQEKIYQPIQDQEQIRNPVVQDNVQGTNGKQQQSTYDNNLASQFQEQVPSGFFQEIPDSEVSQSQWWVPEAQSSESAAILGIADSNDKHRGQAVPTTLEEPILCSNEGFFRHPKNCSRFFRCVKNEQGAFSVHFFQCAKHLYFDEKISHCADSESVKCSSRRTKRQADDISLECNEEGFFRHPNDCRSFYRCVKHESGDYYTHMFSCPANLVFDEEYATCNWPDKAPPCDTQRQFWQPIQASTTPSRPSFKPYQRTTAKGYKSTFKPRNDFIESSNPFTSARDTSRVRSTQKPKYTTQSPSFGQLCNYPGFYRHDEDCTKFYKCVKNGNYFVRYELSCPENYAYDEISSRCVSQKYASSCKEMKNRPPFRQNDEEPSTTAESDIKDEEEELPTENDGIECTEAGYFRNPNDCNKFYRCVDFSGEGREFVRYDFSCPEGLVFDEVKSICNWPDPTAPCEGGEGGGKKEGESNVSDEEQESKETSSSTTPSSTTKSGRQPTTPKKDKSTSRPRENTPKPGKSTSRPKENTPKPGKITSRPRENTPKPGNSTSKPKENTPKPERGTSKPGESTPKPKEGSKQPGESDNSCSEEGFFRNAEDCNKFYRCVDSSGNGQEFIRYDFDCPEGLVFDEANSVCNWPDASAPCESGSEGGKKGEGESNVPDNEGESEESSTRKETDKSTFEPGRSTSKPREGTSKPGKSTSRPREGTSKPGKSTSRPREGTSKPGKSTSRPSESTPKPGKSTSSPGEKTPQPSRSTSKPDESTTKANENSKEPGESTSDNGCTDDGFFRNPEDCNKFYRCVDFNGDGHEFVRYDFDCPEGLVFDETSSVCNWPSEVDDCNSGSSGGSNKNKKESSTSSTKKGQDSTTTKPNTKKDRDSTSTKPSTQKGRESSTAKPNAEKDRDSTTEPKQTDEPEISPSVTESSSTNEENSTPSETKRKGSSNGKCKDEGFFRNPDDCNKFYRCVDQNGSGKEFVKYDFSCPDGLVFDEENSVCNWPDQAAPCEGKSGEKESASEKDENESSTSSTTSKKESTTSTTRKKEDETSTASTTTKREESTTTRRTTKSPSNKTTKRPESTKSPSDKTTKRPQSTRSTTAPQTTISSEESTGGSTATNREETTKDQSSENTKQEGNGECSEEGFFRNPDDCGKFYRCVDFNGEGQEFVKYDFDCPDGLHFDEINSVCNWPEQSPPCKTGTDINGGKSETTESSSTTSKTDSTTKESQSESTKQSDESTSTTRAASTTESTANSGEPSSTTKDESSTSEKESDCSEEGFFRCKDDCNKFYRCVDDGDKLVRYDFKCPEGLIFDDKNKRCDFPSEELSCDNESTSITPSSKQSTTQAPTQTTESESASGSKTTSSESSTKTSKECTEEGYFRDPDNCSKYYRCLDEGDGTLTVEEFSCAEDEVFDEEMRYCNRKDLAPPCEQGTTSAGSQSTSKGSTTNSESSETTSSSSTTPGESTSKESKKSGCRKEGFFRCEEDCNRFYRCIEEDGNGIFKRYNFSCPEGLIFDEKNERCDWPSEELTCEIEITGSSTTSSGPSTSRGSTTEATSTGKTSSTSSESTSGECTEEGYFRNPEDCSKYYRCLDEGDGTLTREDFSCSEDEVFDDEMNYCNRKDLAPPCEESSSSTTGSSTSTTQAGSTKTESESSTTEIVSSTTSSKTSTQTSTTTESNESTTNEESGSTKDSREGSTKSSAESSECKEEGFYRHPDDCNKFYRCVDFAGDGKSYTKYDFECPEGLVFDETNNVCNWPSSVPSCESSDKKATTSSDTEGTSTTNERTTTSTTQSDQSTPATANEATSSTTKKGNLSTETTPVSTSEETDETHSSTTSPTGSTTSDKKSEDAECKEEGFFRNPDDCSKFYRCVDFAGTGESYTRYDFECPDDLVFDDVNNVCNWPNMSPGCESASKKEKNEPKSTTVEEAFSSTTESTTNTDESQSKGTTAGASTGTTSDDSTTAGKGTGTTSSESTTTDVTGTTSGESTTSTSGTRGTPKPSETDSDEFKCKDEGFFRHPKNCKKYYECKRDEDTGEMIKIDCECPEGHVFDEEGWYCNAEELSPPCDDGSFKCEQEGFFRDPEDCSKYYSCNQTGSGFKKESFQCSDGHVFDEEGWYCNAPELTEPCNSTATTSSSSSGTSTTSSSSSGTTSSDQSTPGSETSSKSTSTTNSETSSTSASSTSSGQQDCTKEGFFRNPEDCNKYYQCTRNEDSGELERQDFTCPDGRVFDEEGNYCNDPELTNKPCESSSTTSSTQGETESTTSSERSTTEKTSATDLTSTEGTDSSKTTTTESSTTARTDTSSSTTTTGGASGTRRGGGEPECTQAGFFRNPKDCNKFYRCVDFAGTGESFVRFDFDCPEGLHFDEVNSTCNWPNMSPRCESESK